MRKRGHVNSAIASLRYLEPHRHRDQQIGELGLITNGPVERLTLSKSFKYVQVKPHSCTTNLAISDPPHVRIKAVSQDSRRAQQLPGPSCV